MEKTRRTVDGVVKLMYELKKGEVFTVNSIDAEDIEEYTEYNIFDKVRTASEDGFINKDGKDTVVVDEGDEL